MITDTSRAGLDRLMQEAQRLPTTGARALAPFTNQGKVYLAIAQLAVDVPDQPTRMTGGDHAVDTVIFRWQDGRFVEHQRLPVPGGEDVETFTIGTRRFLATASLRSGSGPYSMAVDSVLFEFVDGHFSTFQRFDTFEPNSGSTSASVSGNSSRSRKA